MLQATVAAAQLSKIQVEDLLTNGNKRDWQFRQYRKMLGTGCSDDGQLYTFLKGGKLQRKRCLNGKLDYKELTWKLVPVPNGAEGEWQLVLGEMIEMEGGNYMQTMRIDLPLVKKSVVNQKMVWRVVPNCKPCREEVVTFTSKN